MRKGPKCPKCAANLVKRKNPKAYHCQRHGFVRLIGTPQTTYKIQPWQAEVFKQLAGRPAEELVINVPRSKTKPVALQNYKETDSE